MLAAAKEFCQKRFKSWLDLRKLEVFIINALILCGVLLAIVVSEVMLQ